MPYYLSITFPFRYGMAFQFHFSKHCYFTQLSFQCYIGSPKKISLLLKRELPASPFSQEYLLLKIGNFPVRKNLLYMIFLRIKQSILYKEIITNLSAIVILRKME